MSTKNKNTLLPIPVVQINLQHSKGASAAFCREVSRLRNYVGLIQEPWINMRNKYNRYEICGLGGLRVFRGFGERPRACVVTSENVKAWPLPDISNEDCVAVLTEWKWGKLIFASVYMPQEDTPPPNIVRKLIRKCETEDIPFLIGTDSNSHHTLWGSSAVNKRGEELLEYLAGTETMILNRGHKPTFVASRAREVLDLTLVSKSLSDVIQGW